jgi:alcohol dehydrogenase class IV
MHALAHPLEARHDTLHGTFNAILMPYVLRANEPALAGPLTALARYLNLPSPGPCAVLQWIVSLRAHIGIPGALRAIGIDATDADEIGRMALDDPSAATNPVAFDAAQYADLFRAAVAGRL